jgi:hypothetical protein
MSITRIVNYLRCQQNVVNSKENDIYLTACYRNPRFKCQCNALLYLILPAMSS